MPGLRSGRARRSAGGGGWVRHARVAGREMNGDLAAEPEPGGQVQVVSAPEAARVIPVWAAAAGQ